MVQLLITFLLPEGVYRHILHMCQFMSQEILGYSSRKCPRLHQKCHNELLLLDTLLIIWGFPFKLYPCGVLLHEPSIKQLSVSPCPGCLRIYTNSLRGNFPCSCWNNCWSAGWTLKTLKSTWHQSCWGTWHQAISRPFKSCKLPAEALVDQTCLFNT